MVIYHSGLRPFFAINDRERPPASLRSRDGASPVPTRAMPVYSYRRRLPHFQKTNRATFVTFVTYKRWILPEAARDVVLNSCLVENGKTAELHLVVVMPDHIHLILTPLIRPDNWSFCLADIMRRIKSRSAVDVNRLLRRQGRVWQQESFDHVLRNNDSLTEKVEYVSDNPQRAGLVVEGEQYRWLWQGEIPRI